jgi:hypothetical protein
VSLAGAVGFLILAALIGWLGIVLLATYRQLDGEAREAARRRRD